MATKRSILISSITGIVPGSAIGTVGTINLPIGYNYSRIRISYLDGGASPGAFNTNFGDIIVYKNTKAQRTHTAAEMERLNILNGSQFGVQAINGTGAVQRQTATIYFAEPWRKDKVDSASGGWNVTAQQGWTTFTVTIALLVAMPATGSIVVYADIDDAVNAPGIDQAIKKVYRQQITASGTSIDVPSLDARDAYQVIALKHPSTGYITRASFKRGSQYFLERQYREDNVALLKQLGLNPADSVTVSTFGYEIVLDADDPMNSSLPVNSGLPPWLQLEFSAAAAGNVVALIERVGIAD
jgi:hypothetical protein